MRRDFVHRRPPLFSASVGAISLTLACLAPGASAAAAGRTLTDDQWSADLDQTLAAIEEHHPAPYRNVDAAELATAAEELRDALPDLSDREAVLRLVELVALLEDGHTRIFLPRQHPELAPALEAGHSGTDPPRHEAIALRQLPVRFGLFADGVFVTRATSEYAELVGLRVVGIGSQGIEDAMQRAFRTIAAGNDSRRRILLPDRLALPDVLAATGITESPQRTDIVLSNEAGEEHRVTLSPLDRGSAVWTDGPETLPLWQRDTATAAWYEVLSDRSAIFVQVNELEATPVRPWASFMRETLEAARQAGVDRYVLDLRHNAGGRGTWITPFINALAGSEFDHYGRLMILMGGHTFSAAQMLVNQLERYTEACFIGEPSGAPPTHYGDSKKVALENSGLTLRVSSLFWPSWLGGDFRKATPAHLDVVPKAADHFAGHDPVLEVALTYEAPASIATQVEDLLRRDKTQAAALRFLRYVSDPRVEERNSAAMEAAGHRLLDDGLVPAGRIVFTLISQLYADSAPAQTGLGRSMELSGDAEAARRHYDQALSLDPAYQPARQALGRLESSVPAIDEALLREHVGILAGDDLEGRGAGYPGERVAADYIASMFDEIGLTPAGDSDSGFLQHFTFQPSAPTTPWQQLLSQNVLALLTGGERLDEIVVLGAHYDGQGRSDQADPGRIPDATNPDDEIWNSADDNATGVAVVIEVARAMAALPERPKRSVLFVAFGAEEHSLAGSVHLVNQLLSSGRRPLAMLNLEKLGRAPGSPPFTASSGTSPSLVEATRRANSLTGLEVASIVDEIIADTDHYPFAVREIPAMVIGTPNQEDVHQPGDHADQIDLPSLSERARYVLAFLLELADGDGPVPFTADTSGHLGLLCTRPTAAELVDAGRSEASGAFKVAAVIDELPGALAGVRAGDLIVSVSGRPLADADLEYPDLDDVVAKLGLSQVALDIVRNGQPLEISIKVN